MNLDFRAMTRPSHLNIQSASMQPETTAQNLKVIKSLVQKNNN